MPEESPRPNSGETSQKEARGGGGIPTSVGMEVQILTLGTNSDAPPPTKNLENKRFR